MSAPITVRFERLAARHDRSAFSCEVSSLTDYLLRYAGQNERKDLASCFVAVDDAERVLGYYTISAHALLVDELSAEQLKGLPRHDRYPAYLIGRLARDVSMRGRGLGDRLLANALSRLADADVAARFVVVDPVDERAAAFYSIRGFAPLGAPTARLYLPMSTISKAAGV